MKLSKCLTHDTILLLDSVHDKWDLLGLMSDVLAKTDAAMNASVDRDIIEEVVLQREQQMSTGLGDGLAFPHARVSGVREAAVCLAILKQPLEFKSIDGKPAQIVCMTMCPEENPTISMKVMAQMVTLLSNKMIRTRIERASSSGEILTIIRDSNLSLDITINAKHIMRPSVTEIYPETPLRDATHKMSTNHLNAIPIIDREGKIKGEITCEILFQVGIPDFFRQLKSVSFIDEFDPFEKYFEQEIEAKAGDVMGTDFCVMPPEATLLEIVFALAVKMYPNVYVVEDEKLIGVIDRSTVLDRIINI